HFREATAPCQSRDVAFSRAAIKPNESAEKWNAVRKSFDNCRASGPDAFHSHPFGSRISFGCGKRLCPGGGALRVLQTPDRAIFLRQMLPGQPAVRRELCRSFKGFHRVAMISFLLIS